MRFANIMMCMPMRPMSWVSGIQVEADVVFVRSRPPPAPRAVDEDVAVREHHALGSLVEPEENWMNAVSSGLTA